MVKVLGSTFTLAENLSTNGQKRPLTFKESQAPYAFGLWANRDDIDEEWLADGRSKSM
ncbi:hypothetical protein [Candidatus Leptofilum sp.]|uniref:hypothetical protein n=1 Tax=Candidatus Leptofilum sp. TaxID=3241576 RepID=UPI003B5A2252